MDEAEAEGSVIAGGCDGGQIERLSLVPRVATDTVEDGAVGPGGAAVGGVVNAEEVASGVAGAPVEGDDNVLETSGAGVEADAAVFGSRDGAGGGVGLVGSGVVAAVVGVVGVAAVGGRGGVGATGCERVGDAAEIDDGAHADVGGGGAGGGRGIADDAVEVPLGDDGSRCNATTDRDGGQCENSLHLYLLASFRPQTIQGTDNSVIASEY